MAKTIRIAGIRGIPASHGGFETFCERLAEGLVSRGWRVTVYCQLAGKGPIEEDEWQGIHRVLIPIDFIGPVSTILFDWKCIVHALKASEPILILGYNTAIFASILRLRRIPVIFNMDGVEWARDKWGWHSKIWLFFNDIAASFIGNKLIADHPEIAKILSGRVSKKKIQTIPYGYPLINSVDDGLIEEYELKPRSYVLLIARAEPENSILDIVKAFCSSKRDCNLVILGAYYPEEIRYHRVVLEAANEQVKFLGPIFDRTIVDALRFHSRLYVHGHQVGGTNPSLVEAIASGAAILAHDNKFNRWCAGDKAHYFDSEEACARVFDEILEDDEILDEMREGTRRRYGSSFRPEEELDAYEHCLADW